MRTKHALVCLFFASLLSGCSFLPSISLPFSEPALESNPTAEALLENGKKDIENKKYARAIITLERISDEFPFSSQTIDAQLQIAEARYLNKQYAEAAVDFKDFLELHPTNENIPFVIYRLGMVNFDQFTSIDRDQKNIEIAKGYFETVIKDHANSPYAAKAREKVAKSREYLAEREFYVASFYLKGEKYPAARERLENILRLYRDTPTAVRALYQLGATFQLEKNSVKASLAYKALIQYYPDSPLVKKSRIQLSQLDNENPDPLAMLLMDGGRPVFISPPEIGAQKENKQVARVAKTEVVEEEGGVEKGFFRTITDTINPFSSSDDEADKSEENGKEEDGFFSSLWPFGKDKKEKGEILEQDNGQVVSSVDESLKKEGILKTKNLESGSQAPQAKGRNQKPEIENEMPRTPAPNLPQVTLEPPSADPKKVLADIDKGLEKGGKELGNLPPPPEASAKLFVSRPPAPKKKQANDQNGRTITPTTTGLLGSIDKGLKTKGIEAPQPEPMPTVQPKDDREKVQPATRQKKQNKVELTPRVGGENTPLFDAGDFQAKGRLEEEEKKVKPASDKPADSPGGLPASLVKGPPPLPSEETPAETTSAGKKSGDEEKGALDQVTEDLKSLRDIFNPFGW